MTDETTTTSSDPITTIDPEQARFKLSERLGAFRRIIFREMLTEGLAKTAGVIVTAVLLSLVLDRWLRLSVPARLILVMLAIGGLVYAVRRWIVQPLRTGPDLLDIAAAVDHANPAGHLLAARVASVLQLPDQIGEPNAPPKAMIERAVARSYDELKGIDFIAQIDRSRARRLTAMLVAMVVILPLFAVLAPTVASLWFKRWFMASNTPWPQNTYLQIAGVTNGRIAVPRGEPYVLRVGAKKDSRPPEWASLQFTEGSAGQSNSAAMTRFGDNDFRYNFSSVQNAIHLRVRGGDDETDSVTIEPIDRPRVEDMELVAKHPADTKEQTHNFSGNDNAPAYLPKTNLKLRITGSVPLAEVHVKSGEVAMDARKIDDKHFEIQWTHDKAMLLSLELVGVEAGLISNPVQVAVGLKQDLPPKVTLQSSGVGQFITAQATLPLAIVARDDYGVAKVDLNVRIEQPSPDAKPIAPAVIGVAGPLQPPSATPVEISKPLQVGPMLAPVGSMVYVTAAATDSRYEGAQVGQSPTRAFRVVENDELMRQILQRLQAERSRFRLVVTAAGAMKEQLVAFKAADGPAMIQQYRAMQRDVGRVQQGIGGALLEMRLNALASVEALNLLNSTVVTPLNDLQDNAMAVQLQTLEQLAKTPTTELANQAGAQQAKIVETMTALLKAMADWDSFVDVLNQLNEVIKIEGGVQDGTQQLKKKQAESIFDK